MTGKQAIEKIAAQFGDAIQNPVEFRQEWFVTVAREKIVEVCRFLKHECAFDMLTDLSGVDNYGADPRFEVDYLLYSFQHACYLRLKAFISETDLTIDTVSTVWRTADWHEREAYDMYGIRFNGHPNLKRILMWEGYPHFPLRKDFPLAGAPADLPEYGEEVGQAVAAPMLGGPFVTTPGRRTTISREPRQFDTLSEQEKRNANQDKAEPV